MMTNRSNHMPTLIRIEIAKTQAMEVRTFLIQSSCGVITLQETMIQ